MLKNHPIDIDEAVEGCLQPLIPQGERIMAKKSKQLRAALEKVEATKVYTAEEAIALAQETNFAKFDATVEVAYNLNIDVEKAEEAKAAGADYVGEMEYVEKINGGWFDFDVVVATPDMMAVVGRLGRVLGPRNLMPNPKTGTVTMDVTKAIEEIKAGKVTYRAEKAGIVHVAIGKVSFSAEKLVENFKAINSVITAAKPATAKGTYIESLTVTTTFGPGIKVDPNF